MGENKAMTEQSINFYLIPQASENKSYRFANRPLHEAQVSSRKSSQRRRQDSISNALTSVANLIASGLVPKTVSIFLFFIESVFFKMNKVGGEHWLRKINLSSPMQFLLFLPYQYISVPNPISPLQDYYPRQVYLDHLDADLQFHEGY